MGNVTTVIPVIRPVAAARRHYAPVRATGMISAETIAEFEARRRPFEKRRTLMEAWSVVCEAEHR